MRTQNNLQIILKQNLAFIVFLYRKYLYIITVCLYCKVGKMHRHSKFCNIMRRRIKHKNNSIRYTYFCVVSQTICFIQHRRVLMLGRVSRLYISRVTQWEKYLKSALFLFLQHFRNNWCFHGALVMRVLIAVHLFAFT